MVQQNDAPHPGEVFADGIGWIGFHGGVVRIDFFSYGTPDATTATVAGKPPDKEPERVVRQRIVMPIDGFLRSLAAMTDLARKLEEGGMIVRRPNAATAPAADTSAAPADKATPPSPNFG